MEEVNEPYFGIDKTIKQLADEARASAIAHYGEAAFAKLCFDFDRSLLSATLYDQPAANEGVKQATEKEKEKEANNNKAIRVFKIIFASKKDPKTLQLALVWLDGHGWGKMKLEGLHWWLDRIRNVYGDDDYLN